MRRFYVAVYTETADEAAKVQDILDAMIGEDDPELPTAVVGGVEEVI